MMTSKITHVPLHWFMMLAGALYFLSDYDANA
jgi:hypothetical protein